MKTSISLVSLALTLGAGSAPAQSVSPDALTTNRIIQVADARPEVPSMTHELATMIQLSHQAQAQYRRTGSPQDLARVKIMQIELARRGLGRAPRAALAQ